MKKQITVNGEIKTCCFTGSRSKSLPWQSERDPRYAQVKERLYAEIVKAVNGGYQYFIIGMATGIDTLAAKLIIKAKCEYENLGIFFEAALPCGEQDKYWMPEQKAEYRKLLGYADRVTLVSANYTPDCMKARNRYMVDHSSMVIAVWDGQSFGTKWTVDYAQRKKKKVTVIQILPDSR